MATSAALKRLQLYAANAVWCVLSIGIVVAVWEGAAALQLIDPLILPQPHLFIAEIQQQAQFLLPWIGVQRVGANFVALTAIIASLQRVLIGLLLAFIASLLIGSFAFYIDVFGKLMLPAVTLLAPIAPVAWIPFALVAFGIGDGAAIFVVFIGIVFTLTLGTVHHMTHVHQVYINSARVLGASRRQVMFHVILPAILPNLFVIMRINFFGAWTGSWRPRWWA
jgi:NitT/TauT family transport system permease protein